MIIYLFGCVWIRKFVALRDSIQSCWRTIEGKEEHAQHLIRCRGTSCPPGTGPMTHYPTFNRADRIHVRLKLSRIMPLFGCNLPFRKSALLPLLSPLFSFLFHNFYSIYLDKFIIFKFLLFLINLFVEKISGKFEGNSSKDVYIFY